MSYKIGKPFYNRSVTPSQKKYSVYVKDESNNIKLIHFGDSSMQQFHDKIGLYNHLDHNNYDRRRRYLARARGIKDRYGRYTYKLKWSPNYYSVKYLW